MKKNLAVQSLVRTALTVVGLAALSVPAFAAAVPQNTPPVGAVVTQGNWSETPVLPPALRPVLYQSLAKDAGAAYDVNAKGCATLPKAKLTACFKSSGVHFTGSGSLALHLVSYGRGQALSPVKLVRPETNGNRVSYKHGNLTEWWRVLPVGFEQGFTIQQRPAGDGELKLALAAGNEAEQRNGALTWGKLHYGGLVVTDANGKVIPTTLKAKGNRVLIAVNDMNAVYPITVDPLVWIEQKATASDGAAGDEFGYSAAVSGATAVIGAKDATVNGNGGQGTVYVFAESDGTWAQVQKLVASDGQAGNEFGFAVALSGDSLLVGAPYTFDAKGGEGTVYAFSHSDGTWTQTGEFSPDDVASGDTFGWSIAISGTKALISSPCKNACAGAAYIFSESDGTWSEVQELTESDANSFDTFGYSVALDGSTALVGASGVNNYFGAAYVFDGSSGTWTQTAILTPSDGISGEFFGIAVAVRGGTALVGAYNGLTSRPGAAYVFTESNGAWVQTQKLTAKDGAEGNYFGESVALDGTTALIGAPYANVNGVSVGAAYVFKNSGGTWAQTQKLVASDNEVGEFFGVPVVLAEDTALVGAFDATIKGHDSQGAVYFYGESNLGLAVSAPQTVGQGQEYTSQTIATNSSSVASPAVSATITVPAAASFVSAMASQGSCSEGSGVVTCDFGQIEGNAGTAAASVTLKATGSPGTTIENTASIAKATPPLTASAATTIGEGGACPAGYTEFSGHLDAGGTFTSAPITVSEAGQKYVDLTSPASFAFFAITTTSYGQHTYVYPHKKHGHRWGAAGSYQVGVQAGPDAGGDYTLCVNLNPAE